MHSLVCATLIETFLVRPSLGDGDMFVGQIPMLRIRYPLALSNPKTSVLIQKRRPYTENLNSETPGDSKNTFLHWGDVSVHCLLFHDTGEQALGCRLRRLPL